MRQLLPVAADPVDPTVVYADLPVAAGRPAVRPSQFASLDGAATVGGLSGGLGGPADQRVLGVLRGLADVVLVAAGTVRAEGYGPLPVPLAIVSRSCALDFGSPLFTGGGTRPILVTVASAPADRVAAAREVADVLIAGDSDVDLCCALQLLGTAGHCGVLAEGGPHLNAQLAAADLIDELCLTIAPYLIGGDSRRILAGPPVGMSGFALHTVCEDAGFLFLRLRPRRNGSSAETRRLGQGSAPATCGGGAES